MTWRDLLQPNLRSVVAPYPTDYRAFGDDCARMDLNESPLPPDRAEMALFQRELAKLDLNRYPEVSGRTLRERLAEYWGVQPEQILLGNGSVETIGMLMTAFGAPRHGEPTVVLHPEPTYGQYDTMASGYGLRAVSIPLGARFELDESRVAAAIEREHPGLAFYPTPNSPTGNCFSHEALQRLAGLMQGVFVVDEAYADFAGESIVPRIANTPGLFVMRSLSKIGFAGLRVGALIGERDAIAEIDKIRLPFNVSSVSLALAHALLSDPERLAARIAVVVRLRRGLEAKLAGIEDVEVFPSRANFVLVRTPYPARLVFDRLLARGVLVRVFEGSARLARCLRITAGTLHENACCVEAMRASLSELRRSASARSSPAEFSQHGSPAHGLRASSEVAACSQSPQSGTDLATSSRKTWEQADPS